MKHTSKILAYLLLFIVSYSSLSAQCTYLAYDGFNYNSNTPLNGLSGGTGWAAPWNVQSEPATVPGYQSNNGAGSLLFGALQTQGRYATGGDTYLTAGRQLNAADNGAFANYVADYDNGIGTQTGDTLWVSMLLRKDENNTEPVWLDLHSDGNIPWYNGNAATQHIAVGYFGSTNSEVAGERRWTLRLNNSYYPTLVAITANSTAFVVLRIIFNNNNTNVAMYVNPALLGNNVPTSAAINQNANVGNVIRSAALYLGNNAASGAIDELRFATSYSCVAPDNTIAVNLPPTAVIVAAPTSGQAPLMVSFNGGASSDPEGQALTYLWNFGDGSPIVTGITPFHTYTNTGQLTASLTVADNFGLQHTIYQTINVLDANGTYPCQTSFTVQNMPNCTANNGHIVVNNAPALFALRNSSNALMPISSGNHYQNLAAGVYTFTANGGTGGCTDTFQLHLDIDSTTCAGWQPSSCAMDIGTNLSGFADWGVERPMKNLFKHVRSEPIAFTTTCFCWSLPVLDQMAFDTNGYPTHIPQTTSAGANTVVRYVISSESETGTNLQLGTQYVLLYNGVGLVQVGGGVAINSSAAGRIQFSVTANNNLFIEILASTMGNNVRNIRLLRLTDEFADLNANPFYQGFVDKVAPFKMLRFMDWGATNNNPAVAWSNRTQTSYFTYGTPTGVPYEVMIQLANQLNKDVWICVPHQANDNYIAQMATLFRDNLNPNLNVYLEYSNEVWNWIFEQAHYNDDNRPTNLNYGRAYSEKAKHVFQIWHSVYGAQKSRVKRVLGIQTTYNYLNEQILSQLDQSDWDYGSPTHYFGLEHSNTGSPILNAGSTPQNIITNARNTWYDNKNAIKSDYNQIKLFGKLIATYEGGQHFVGNVFGIPYNYQQAMWDAQYTPEIYGMYNEVLDTIRAWGCKLAGNFSFASPQESVYGSWGVLNDIDVQAPYMVTAPKYQALLDNMPNRPTPIITGNNTVCSAGAQTYTVAALAGSTYIWTVSGGTIISGEGTHTITVQWANGVTGTVNVLQTAP